MLTRCFVVWLTWAILIPSPLGSFAPPYGVSQNPAGTPSNIHKLVRDVAWNEVRASEHPAYYYRYIDQTSSSDGYRTNEEISTRYGIVDRLLQVNGHSPSEQQLRQNQRFLSKLAKDTILQNSRLKEQTGNRDRRNNVIRDLPNAFLYEFVGREKNGFIHLRFHPDPNFHPRTRQGEILAGMAGELWIDPVSQRMVQVNGRLIKDATIGWGFLARLYRGGRFLIQQTEGPDKTWQQSFLSVTFDGKEMLVKGLHIRVREVRCCFERIPSRLTIPEAVQMTKEAPLPENWESALRAAEQPNTPD